MVSRLELQRNLCEGTLLRESLIAVFLIKATRGRPKHDIKEVLHPANRNERLAKLHQDIKSHRKLLLAYRLIHFSDDQRDIATKLEGKK